MKKIIQECFDALIGAISTLPEVGSIGKSGGAALPSSDESDIDIFVFCDEIPKSAHRHGMLQALDCEVNHIRISSEESKHWGYCDFVHLNDHEMCVMYFTYAKMQAEVESILAGERLGKENNYFYPTGRCATLLSMHILYDQDGFIASMQQKLSVYPPELSKKMILFHMENLEDTEDLLRAVHRKDTLFYHFALDLSMDHFLQALYALNLRFFPSRKRTIQHIEAFGRKPDDCTLRLLSTLALGGSSETVAQSYEVWSDLCAELARLTQENA